MNSYHDLLRKLMKEGSLKQNRTGIPTIGVFGTMLQHDLSTGFPLLTTKKMFWRGIVEELLFFIRGDTDTKKLSEKGIKIWDGNTSREFLDSLGFGPNLYPEGEMGPGYGFQWRNWNGTYRSHMVGQKRTVRKEKDGLDQLQQLIQKLKDNPDDRRMIVSAWNADSIHRMALPPCFPGEAPVLTDRGYKNIEDIQKGDMVLSEDGEFHLVNETFKTPFTDPLVQIKRNFGLPLKSTENHPFLVKDRGWVKAGNIQPGDYVGIPSYGITRMPEKTQTKQVNFNKRTKQMVYKESSINLTEDDYFFLGYFVGDGWINHDLNKDSSKRNRYYLAIHNKHKDFMIPFVEKVTGNKLRRKKQSGECEVYESTTAKFGDILREFGHTAHNKKIPLWVLESPDNYIRKFLEGYLRADGCIDSRGYLQYTTVSRNLALGLQMLHWKLGEDMSIRHQTRPKQTIIEGRVVNQRDTYNLTWNPSPKNESPATIKDNGILWTRVLDVSNVPNDQKFVYNLSVQDTHTYTVWNTVTHNCHMMFQCYVSDNKLSLLWYQRSVDTFLGLPFNIASYALLTHLLAKLCNYDVGILTFMGGDTHFYENHLDQIQEQVNRIPFSLPTLQINKDINSLEDIEQLEFEDLSLMGYQCHPPIIASMAI